MKSFAEERKGYNGNDIDNRANIHSKCFDVDSWCPNYNVMLHSDGTVKKEALKGEQYEFYLDMNSI